MTKPNREPARNGSGCWRRSAAATIGAAPGRSWRRQRDCRCNRVALEAPLHAAEDRLKMRSDCTARAWCRKCGRKKVSNPWDCCWSCTPEGRRRRQLARQAKRRREQAECEQRREAMQEQFSQRIAVTV